MLYALHGFTETDQSWSDVLEPTHLQYRSVLLPGHGARPCDPEGDLASVAAELAQELPADGSADLIGYSMGGRVALQLALDHPERVRRLVLVSCCPGIIDPGQREERRLADEGLAEILEQDGIGAFLASWEANPTLKTAAPIDPELAAVIRSRRLNQEPELLACAIRSMGQGRMPPLWQRLPELPMRTLLICGAIDERYRSYMQQMAAQIPNNELVVVPDCGHAVHRENPKALIKNTLDFLIG